MRHGESATRQIFDATRWIFDSTRRIFGATWRIHCVRGSLHLTAMCAHAAYSDVPDGYAGSGNLNSDPLFVNAAHGDFTLQATTPCKNAGSGTMPDDIGDLDWDNITSEPVPLDLASGARVNVTIDMGAYEIQAGHGGGGDD